MTNMVTPPKSTPVTRRRKEGDSSSSEESEELDYTFSPKSQFFPDKMSTPYPPKRFSENLVKPISPIDRPLSLHDELIKAIQTPGDIESQRDKQPHKQTLREAMDIINYPIKTRQSTFYTNPVTDEQQYHDITVSKAKPKDWVSWKETLMQTIPHPPEDMAFKQWRHPKKTFESSQSSQESFNSPEPRNQQDESISRPSTSRGEEIYEAQAGSTPKSQTSSSSKEPGDKSTNTSSSDTDSESDADEFRESKEIRPPSAAAQAKKAQLKGQRFLKKQYKKFDLISLAKPKKKTEPKEEQITTRSGRVVKKPDKLDY